MELAWAGQDRTISLTFLGYLSSTQVHTNSIQRCTANSVTIRSTHLNYSDTNTSSSHNHDVFHNIVFYRLEASLIKERFRICETDLTVSYMVNQDTGQVTDSLQAPRILKFHVKMMAIITSLIVNLPSHHCIKSKTHRCNDMATDLPYQKDLMVRQPYLCNTSLVSSCPISANRQNLQSHSTLTVVKENIHMLIIQ